MNRFFNWLCCYLVFGSMMALGRWASAQEAKPAPEPLKYEREGDWKPLFKGVEGLKLTVSSPRKMKAFAVRIALETPGLEFVSTSDNGEKEGETDGVYTSTFLKQQKCQLAINAGAFGPVTDLEGSGKNIVGLHVSEGKLVSPWEKHHDSVLIGEKNDVRITKEEVRDLSGVRTAVCGFNVLLWKGEPASHDTEIHPRTVLGLSKDSKTMYWLVIDGRQPGYSEGAKIGEAALLLKELGAETGINLDGGGTTALAIEAPGGGAKLINRPIHRSIPGLERPAASHLGIRAAKLK